MSRQAKGWILLVCSYLLPLLCNLIMMRGGLSTLTETGAIISIVVIIAAIPTIYIYINLKISKLIRLKSMISALILFTGMIQLIITGYFILTFKDKEFQVDLKTFNIYVTIISYYLLISLVYYLFKKDDNIIPVGDSK